MAANEKKPRAEKSIVVMRLIGGKMVTRLSKSEADKLHNSFALCGALLSVPQYAEKAKAAADKLHDLIQICDPPEAVEKPVAGKVG